jgi:hypothetical protein
VNNKKTKRDRETEEKTHLMYSLIRLKTLASCALLCLAFLPQMQAATDALHPPPDGCYPNFTTAEGCNALHSLTSGAGNTGVGWYSLFLDTTGNFNTGIGGGTLALNNGDSNSAGGAAALLLNDTGTRNTAFGTDALVYNGYQVAKDGDFNGAFGAFSLFSNRTGFSNNAMGDSALFENINGAANTAVGDLALSNNDVTGDGKANFNVAVGAEALFNNTNGDSNNAVGAHALHENTIGLFNQAMGFEALAANTDGAANVAVGDSALSGNSGGSFNTVVGDLAGATLEGSDNIYIGATAGDGVTNEDGTIRIGDPAHVGDAYIAGIFGNVVAGVPVLVDANGHLGTAPAGSPLSQNEMLKQRQIVQELKAATEKQAAVISLQQDQIKSLVASLKEQATQIQKVSAQLEMVRPTPRVVENR